MNLIKYLYLFSIVLLIIVAQTSTSLAQGVGINNSNSPPDGSAMLDVFSNNKGVLIPRLTTSEQLNIPSPATGLLIFNNDSAYFMYFDGNFWISWCHTPCLPPPPKPIAVAGPDITICNGDFANLNGSCSNCTGSVIYSWSATPPTGNMSDPNISNPVVNPTTTTTYTLTVTAASGVGTDNVVVTVWDVPPTPGPISGPTPICPLEGDLTYSVPALPNNPPVTYHWYVESGDTILSGQGTNVVVVNFMCAKLLPTRVCVYAENVCGFSDTAYFTVNEPPPPCAGEIDLTDARDGKIYKIIELGCQCWMGQNLNIGSMVIPVFAGEYPTLTNIPGQWEKWCYGDVPANCDTFGGYYDWNHAVQHWDTNFTQAPSYPVVQGICPSGWHIPTSPEFQTLWNFVDSCTGTYKSADYNFNPMGHPDSNAVGDKIKFAQDCSMLHFASRTNPIDCGVSGFNAEQAGFWLLVFWIVKGYSADYWSATRRSVNGADTWQAKLMSSGFGIENGAAGNYQQIGFSIRCLKD